MAAQDPQQIEEYQQLLETYPPESAETIPIHLTLGKLYERAGDTPAAVQEYATAAVLYADHGEIMKAMAAVRLVVRLDPDNDDMLERLEELYFSRGSVSETVLENYQDSLKTIESWQHERQPEPVVQETEGWESTGEAPEMMEETDIDVMAALKQVDLLTKLSVSELRGIKANSTLYSFAAGAPILTHGNGKRALYVILQGTVKVFGRNEQHQKVFFTNLGTGKSFGELALFGAIDPNLSVAADTPCAILEVPREIMLKLAKKRPQIVQMLKEMARRRFLDSALAKVQLFKGLSPLDRKKFVPHFKPVRAAKGATVIREADPGDSMYFIASGQVGVYTSLLEADDENSEQVQLATLQSGDFFGEHALVTDEPRSATVTALTDVILMRLTKNDLQQVMTEYPLIESALQIQAFQHDINKRLSLLKEAVPT